MFVDESMRGKGVGKKLAKAALGEMKRRSCEKVYLFSEGNNVDAHAFYQRLGFKLFRVLSNYYAEESDAYELVFDLNEI